jgi:glucose/arabinose dehydrogenase/mono/diheme cytochrome c family protein
MKADVRLLVFFLSIYTAGAAPFPTERVSNTTLTVPLQPPQLLYSASPAFGNLNFPWPVGIVSAPGETDRLFVIEQAGRIGVITNLANPSRTLFLDIASRTVFGGGNDERGLLGLAFHPGYLTNRYFYVFYTANDSTAQGTGMHARVSRFEIDPENPNQALPDSEAPLISQFHRAGNHNAGDLHFGPDGYLYISTGDEGGGNDQFNNSQRINGGFFSAILRIDVDQRPESLPPNPHPASIGNYAIPPDNPFIGATSFNGIDVNPNQVRTEIYAIGLRNPWRMSFDRATGLLYVGDVGQSAREEINIIQPGGNYGWAYREGSIARPGSPAPPPGFSAIDPIQDYVWGDGVLRGRSVTGGVVYRGTGMPELQGHYVFGDFVSGNIWVLLYEEGELVSPMRRITVSSNVSAFGIDPSNGDVLIAARGAGRILRLGYSPQSTMAPPTLAETGAFSDLATLTPEPGIYPYQVNLPRWAEGARTRAWFALPEGSRIEYNQDGYWEAPVGTVWITHSDLEMVEGDPESTRPVETRFVIRNNQGVHGLSYRWDASGENALLVPAGGAEETFLIQGEGGERSLNWRFAAGEIAAAHPEAANFMPEFKTTQMNWTDPESGLNQIAALSQVGFFDEPVSGINLLPRLAGLDEEEVSRQFRVRSYLEANCAHCHQTGGSAPGLFNALSTVPLSEANLIHGELLNTEGNPAMRVVTPGEPENSMLLARMTREGAGRMPPGAHELDLEAIQLMEAWIEQDLPHYETFEQWQVRHFGSTESPEAQPEADPDDDGAKNALEFLTGTNPLDPADPWSIGIQREENRAFISFPRVAGRGFELQSTTDLFDPDSWAPVDIPGNRPFYSGADFMDSITVEDAEAPAEYFRVRVYEQ